MRGFLAMRRALAVGLGLPAAAVGVWAARQERPAQAAGMALEVPVRLGRDVLAALATAIGGRRVFPSPNFLLYSQRPTEGVFPDLQTTR